MSPTDPYGRTDKLDDSLLDVLVTRLEARGKHPFFAGMLSEYLDVMQIDAAASVLDMGCGTGVASRALARRPGFAGKVTGIDLSPYLVQAAAHLARRKGLMTVSSSAPVIPEVSMCRATRLTLSSHTRS